MENSFVYIFVYLCRIGMTIYTLLLTSSQYLSPFHFEFLHVPVQAEGGGGDGELPPAPQALPISAK